MVVTSSQPNRPWERQNAVFRPCDDVTTWAHGAQAALCGWGDCVLYLSLISSQSNHSHHYPLWDAARGDSEVMAGDGCAGAVTTPVGACPHSPGRMHPASPTSRPHAPRASENKIGTRSGLRTRQAHPHAVSGPKDTHPPESRLRAPWGRSYRTLTSPENQPTHYRRTSPACCPGATRLSDASAPTSRFSVHSVIRLPITHRTSYGTGWGKKDRGMVGYHPLQPHGGQHVGQFCLLGISSYQSP